MCIVAMMEVAKKSSINAVKAMMIREKIFKIQEF
jgi:hypothetical protein